MIRTILVVVALAATACGAVVRPTTDGAAQQVDTGGVPPDTVVPLPDALSTLDVDAVDAALVDVADARQLGRDAALDVPELGCGPVGPPGATAIVTDADMAFPDGALTLEEWVDWDERMRNLDVVRCPIESRGSTTYLTTSRVAPDPTDREVVGRMRRRLYVVRAGLATFDGTTAHACLVAWRARPLCGVPPYLLLPECRHVLQSAAPTQTACTDNFQCAEGSYCNLPERPPVNPYSCVPIPAVTVLAPSSGAACTPVAAFASPAISAGVLLCPDGETCGQPYGESYYRCLPVIAPGCRGAYSFYCAAGYRADRLMDSGVTRCNPTPELHYPDHGVGESCDSLDHVDAGPGRGVATFYDRCAPGLVCAYASATTTDPSCLAPSSSYRCDYRGQRGFTYAVPLESYCNEDSGRFEPLLPVGAIVTSPDECASQCGASLPPDGGIRFLFRCASTVSPDGGYVY